MVAAVQADSGLGVHLVLNVVPPGSVTSNLFL